MKKIPLFLTVLALALGLSSCSLFGPDKKIFEDDVNSAVNAIKNPDSDESKSAIDAMYQSFIAECDDLDDSQQAALQDLCKQLYSSFYSNVKCDNITVNVSGETANVDTNITVNDIQAMRDDMQSEVEKLSASVQGMSADELNTFFGVTDISTLSESQITYQILTKGLDNALEAFKNKDYSKASPIKLVYTQSGNEWNITNDSEKQLTALLNPDA